MGYVDDLLGKGERILVISRQHWTTLLASALINLFIAIVILVIYALAGSANVEFLASVRGFFLFALLYPLGKFGWDLIQWEAEQYIVTNYRVIQTEGIVNKKTSDSSLEKVNDIVLTQSVLGRMLGYGDLAIITGSDVGTNLLRRLNEPVRFKTAILDAKVALNTDHDDARARAPRQVPVSGAFMGASRPAAADNEDDPLRQIAELDNLRKTGAISDAEYQTAKARLLAKL